jgi:ABC-type oligopeptide transport system substrate-binding subunit
MADLARGQVKLAAEANTSGDRERAAQYLDAAQEIWPELDLVDLNRQAWDKEYPIMRCAYPYLPMNFSPFSVQTPVDRHAASLIFESLVRWTNCVDGGLYYRPCLAEDSPVPLARGRQFQLRRCEWCDHDQKGEARMYFSAEDVIWTEQLQRQNPWASAQVSMLENVSHDHGDPFRVDLLLKMDHWQPMSFMDFWILPKYRFPQGTPVEVALEELNERPVGTGPYFLAERRQNTVRFRANPRFRERGLPRIKEIQFHQMEPQPGFDQFLAGKVDMIYGVRKAHRDALTHAGKQSTLQRLNTPSVYFLAPNYAQPNTPLADSNFRLAIAHAIDREEVLNQYFRENAHDRANCQLTGPFPHDSWAYNTTVPQFQRIKAGSFLDLAKKKLGTIRPITLLYPNDDPNTEIACGRIKDDLQNVGVEIEIEPVNVREFYDRVVKQHDFDLVYWRHDFLNATYWLWPLFDPKAKDPGTNFMGYDPDPDLVNLFFQLREHKRFAKIRELTNRIHEHIATNAIVIPLWQLDTYVAVSDRLHNITLDPWTLFGDVQDWSLTPARP